MRVAMIQMAIGRDKQENLRHAEQLLEQLDGKGVDLAILPEMFSCGYSNKQFRICSEPVGGETWQRLSRMAQKLGIYLVGGSIPEREDGNIYNTSFLFDRNGNQIARHRKIHLFDIEIDGGQRFCESATLSPGSDITVVDTDFGKLGLCICFDMRFQELAKIMGDRGAQLLVVPAAFNMTTGPAHWELMFRQRAVDNQLFTIGVAPARNESASYVSYANSILVDPWGTVIERAGIGEELLIADMDLSRCGEIRRQLPIRAARRNDLY